MEEKTFTVVSTNGNLEVDARTGKIVSRDYPGLHGYIVQFDVAEWRRTYPKDTLEGQCHDILDFGYWAVDGTYEDPEYGWRKEFQEERKSNRLN